MAIYSEKELILPALEIIDRKPRIATSELIDILFEYLTPSGTDLDILTGRNDTKFSQKVRNLISHHTIDQNGLNYIFSDYDGRNWFHTITEKGKAYLKENDSKVKKLFDISEIELRTFSEDDSPEIPPPDIIAYNELRSCADLFRLYKQEYLDIKPYFQREIVWKGPDQTRFIDSLIKQLPIPSMCFSLDYKTQKWQVIDGLQRMATIIKFLSGEEWILSSLEDIDQKISGKSTILFHDPNSELNILLRRVENLTLPITVLRCDYTNIEHTNFLFTIFHRLNTGGVKLNNQEIRNCIYSGPFNDLLHELNAEEPWLKINRMETNTGYRFIKQELILRFFAFHDCLQDYDGRLARFLNRYMDGKRLITQEEINKKRELFKKTIKIVYEKVYKNKAPSKIQITILESLLIGISKNIEYLENKPADLVLLMYQTLLRNMEFSEEKLREGLSGKQRVKNRINEAIKIFSGEV